MCSKTDLEVDSSSEIEGVIVIAGPNGGSFCVANSGIDQQ